MNICFIMYPWERINPQQDSTLRIIRECCLRGYTVAITTPNMLTIRDSIALGLCQVIKKKKPSSSYSSFYKNTEMKEKMLPLAGFDVIFMRAEPPLDPIMLNFLDSVKGDTFIVNDIDGLRMANNKLYTAAFYDPNNEIIPKTYVSKNIKYLRQIIEESETDRMIMKPLNGFGGSGVIVLEKGASSNISSLLDFYVGKEQGGNYVILQNYVEGAEKGDTRVLMLHGEPIGAVRRVPATGELRSNISAGGKEVKHILTKEEKRMCKIIGPKLVQDGLYFVGLDIIGGKLIEVNVCSPGGINYINKMNRVKLEKQIIDYAEDMVRYKETARIRKQEFRQTVSSTE